MFCRECQYDLRGRSEHHCPKCGRVFDPKDSTTYNLFDFRPFRPLRIYLAIGVVLLVLCGLPYAWQHGPRSQYGRGCDYCGRERISEWRLGIKIRDKITTNSVSAWVDSIHPDHVCRVWTVYSRSSRGWGTGEMIACGGTSVVNTIYNFGQQHHDMAKAREIFDGYHARLAKDTSRAQAMQYLYDSVPVQEP